MTHPDEDMLARIQRLRVEFPGHEDITAVCNALEQLGTIQAHGRPSEQITGRGGPVIGSLPLSVHEEHEELIQFGPGMMIKPAKRDYFAVKIDDSANDNLNAAMHLAARIAQAIRGRQFLDEDRSA